MKRELAPSTHILLTPRAVQWEFVSLLALAFALSRVPGAIGDFLRSYAAYLFP